jgi:predicted nicotinamide N-methyase
MPAPEPSRFIATRLPLTPVGAVPEIVLHTAHPGSGLRELTAGTDEPPYWAYPWAGGIALARYILDHPESVAGRRILDLGAGGGPVGIAAAKAGAREVTASERDPSGRAAIALNAAANGVAIAVVSGSLLMGPAPDTDLVVAGDVFYAPEVAARVLPFLDRCLAAGLDVLVGDPWRKPLPLDRLSLLATYDVPDFGSGTRLVASGVFTLSAAPV